MSRSRSPTMVFRLCGVAQEELGCVLVQCFDAFSSAETTYSVVTLSFEVLVRWAIKPVRALIVSAQRCILSPKRSTRTYRYLIKDISGAET